MTMMLPVVEVFGPTVQGEGPYAGRAADFIRLGGCNLNCIWCDTPYSWDGSRYDLRAEITAIPVTEILGRLSPGGGIVVITGGEPLLYARAAAFEELLERIRALGRPIHIETNGTIAPTVAVEELVSVFVVSPKLASAQLRGHPRGSEISAAWADLARRGEVHVKVVCVGADDVEAAVALTDREGFDRERVWVMPEASDQLTLAERWPVILEAAVAHGINATSRLHLLAWGNSRGR